MLNPVFRREVRTVLRTWKTFISVSLYVLCLAVVVGLTLMSMFSNMMHQGFNPQSSTMLYGMMCGAQMALIMLIVPALAGGAISNERERQTFDLMLVTKMSTFSIVLGKLMASLVMVLLMVVASLPVFGIVLYYGGVNIGHLFAMAGFFLVTATFVGSISIFFSSIFKKTVVGIIATYLILGFVCVGIPLGMFLFGRLMSSYNLLTQPPMGLAYMVGSINPFVGFVSVTDSQLGGTNAMNFVQELSNYYGYNYSGSTPVLGYGYGTGAPPFSLFQIPLWVFNVPLSLCASVGLVLWASFIIRPAKKSKIYK